MSKPNKVFLNPITIEGAQLRFRNFSGSANKYNEEGKRNFCVFLSPDVAETLRRDGWNVRWLEPRDPEEDKQAYLQVKVVFKNFPPKIVLITSKNTKTDLDEGSVMLLDLAEIANVDLIIRPYSWGPINGKSGVAAYLKTMYVTLKADEFAGKYKDVPTAEDDEY